MSRDPLIKFIKNSIEDAKIKGGKDSLREELLAQSSMLNSNDLHIVNDLIDIIDNLKNDKGVIIDLIKTTIMIVERIKGRNNGHIKKQEALDIFTEIIDSVGVSQRDRKFYMSIFDNTIEMAFWGRDWFKSGGLAKVKRFFICL